jgi:hypothetical protein
MVISKPGLKAGLHGSISRVGLTAAVLKTVWGNTRRSSSLLASAPTIEENNDISRSNAKGSYA